MKFTLSWLKEHLNTGASLETILEALTQIGLEVEKVSNPGDSLKGFKIAKILEAQSHPNADRLKVCTVDYGGKEKLQIVCGAPNARAGLKVVLGLPGTHVPTLNLTLKETTIRGVQSFGMMCSSRELGLGEDHEGIIEVAESASLGQEFVEFLNLNDPFIEISVTPNRPDCLGVRGIARDLAAAGLGTLKAQTVPSLKGKFQSSLKVTRASSAEDACPHYMGREIRGVKNRPSPDWLQMKLKSIGVKPISALVDITNYLAFDLCRPLHVFDRRTLKGKVDIRFAQSGERFMALDGKEYRLDSNMLTISDTEKVLALAGVMGGSDSGCTLETETVFLESAYFDPATVASTGRRLNLLSDSRQRFERGIDPLSVRLGLEKATELILEICGGEPSDLLEVGGPSFEELHIPFTEGDVEKRTGVKLTKKETEKILKDLGFSFKEKGTVSPPSWRPDVTQSVDLVEEVIRIHGYDKLPAQDLEPVSPQPMNAWESPLLTKARHVLASRSFMEIITWSMVSEKEFKLFGGTGDALKIVNPISEELEYLRPSPLVHMLHAVRKNLDRGLSPLAFFEIGPRYRSWINEEGEPVIFQDTQIVALCVGTNKQNHWSKKAHTFDVFDIKGDLLSLLDSFGVSPEEFEVCLSPKEGKIPFSNPSPSWYHPGRKGALSLRGQESPLAWFGELHPSLLDHFGIKDRVVAFEINSVSFLDLKIKAKKQKASSLFLSPFQKVERDFCFLFEDSLPASRILDTLKSLDSCIKDIDIFDIYVGDKIPKGQKSVSIHLSFEPKDHTFSDKEIKELYDRVVKAAETKLQGVLRL